MSHTPHELADEFPGAAALIRAMKDKNAHFARLADAYHDINRAIHRYETDVEPVSDAVLEVAKKQRLALKDEIAGLLAQAG